MKPFADLLEALIFSPRRSVKSAHLVRWIKQTSFPDKGWGIAALIGELNFPHLKASVIRQLARAGQLSQPDRQQNHRNIQITVHLLSLKPAGGSRWL